MRLHRRPARRFWVVNDVNDVYDRDGMAKVTVGARVAPWLADELRTWAEEPEEVSVSALVGRLVEEGWVRERLAGLEVREDATGRRVGLRGGPGVWKVVSVLPPHLRDADVLVEIFDGILAEERVRQAMAYYRRFEERVQGRVEANASAAGRLELLPSWSVPPSDLLAGWFVLAETVAALRSEGVDLMHVADLEDPPGGTAAFIDRAASEGRVLVTADYRGVGAARVARERKPERWPVALLAPELVQAGVEEVGAAILAWTESADGGERGRWIRPA